VSCKGGHRFCDRFDVASAGADGQLATSGITTVLDSLRVWREDGAEEVDVSATAISDFTIDNVGNVEDHARRLLRIIKGD
jgi:alpha-D-ribose 1-methylphosphonate 5-triphosphate diphosphatase PhnM